jgi:small subunit ribosomal protein S17
MPKKQLQGKIISDKMQKTIVVRVETIKVHPKYKKRFKAHKNFKADNSNNEYHIGDNVIIEETVPMSKNKKWKVVGKI